ERFALLMRAPEELHTQEKALVLLAAQALLRTSGPVAIAQNGERLAKLPPAPSFTLDADEVRPGITYRNEGDGPIFRTVTVSGAPKVAPPPIAAGFAVTKRVATRDGRPADLASVRQNDRLVIVIAGSAAADRLHPAIIADLLPSGFEIETILGPDDGAATEMSGPYKWIGPISYTRIAEARDDRFVAAIDLRREPFTLAYVVRAVTPGSFVIPGVVVEDMYRPGVVGRTSAAQVTIAAAQ
ncbi:MAG: hypothetical protein WD076_01225, partial [Parvularculaceae bacterium]